MNSTLLHCLFEFRLFYRSIFTLNRCSCTASARPVLSHIARYAPEYRTSSYGTITQFKCKNNYEHLLIMLFSAYFKCSVS